MVETDSSLSKTFRKKESGKRKKKLKLKYRMIGYGFTRVVYDLGNGYVLKIALSKRGIKSNQREINIYHHCSKRLRKHLCKVKEYGHGWLVMKKLDRIQRFNNQDKASRPRIRKLFLREHVIARSLREKNLARVHERLVVIDYGSFRFTKNSLEKRLK